MNQRRYHAATLALVTWYPLFPPTTRKHPTGNVSAPVSKWQRRTISAYRKNQFPDRQACESELDRLVKQIDPLEHHETAEFYKRGQCISSDDPRLKEK
jgi:hypothetical protein